MKKKFELTVNKTFKYNLKSTQLNDLDLIELSDKKFHVIHNNKPYSIELLNKDFYKKEYTVTVNTNKYTIKINNELDLLIKKMGFSKGSSKKETEIKAPMPGLILSLNVTKGQKVKEGDVLLILEAMKMENSITALKDSTIKQVNIKSGETVEKGQLLIELN